MYTHGCGSKNIFFRITGGCWKSRTSSLKRVTGRMCTISKGFHRSKQKLYFRFSSQKDNQNCGNLQRSVYKFTCILFPMLRPSNLIFILWHYLFKMRRFLDCNLYSIFSLPNNHLGLLIQWADRSWGVESRSRRLRGWTEQPKGNSLRVSQLKKAKLPCWSLPTIQQK